MHTPEDINLEEGPDRGLRWLVVLVVLAFIGCAAIGGWLLWLNRDVRVHLNGTPVDIRCHSSFEDVCAAAGVTPRSGDLYSITGNLIEAGGGEPYTVLLDGSPITRELLQALEVDGGESFVVQDGGDLTEDSEVVEREVAPRLVPAESLRAVTFVRQWGVAGISRVRVGSVSGEEILEEVVREPQDCVLDSVNPSPSDGRKLVCLTFDDGPSSYTQQILEILVEKGARATFFTVGTGVAARPDDVRAIEESGCEVMSHTMNHLNHSATSSEVTHQELVDAFVLLSDVGVQTSVIRPPYGNWDPLCWISSRGTVSASVIWNIDSHDWELPGVDAIVENCTSDVDSGDIILMHDGGGDRSQDVEALPLIIDELHDQGFELVTVSELMASDDRIPDEVARQYAPMPEGCAWPAEVA